jgi:hypothetical protein
MPLKESERPAVFKSFSVEDVRTSELHHLDARSSFSSFYTKLDFMFRHGSGYNNHLDGRATPSGCFSGFQEDFCIHHSVFIITLCSSIGLRQNWYHWKAMKKIIQLECLDSPPSRWKESSIRTASRIALFLKGGRRRPFGRG